MATSPDFDPSGRGVVLDEADTGTAKDPEQTTSDTGTDTPPPPPPDDPAVVEQQILDLFAALSLAFPDFINADPATASEPDRLARMVEEVMSGTRNVTDIQNDLLAFVADQSGTDIGVVAEQYVASIFGTLGLSIGTADETEEERLARISGEILGGASGTDLDTGTSLFDIQNSLANFVPDTVGDDIFDQPSTVGDTTIPSGASLIIVEGDNPGDPVEYFLSYEWNGVQFNFSIGGEEEFAEFFPDGVNSFQEHTSISRRDFVESGAFGFVAGTIDEILGSTESLAVQLQRQFDLLSLESVPQWILDSPEAMGILIQSTMEEWSQGRTANALAQTAAFAERFVGFDAIMTATGSNDVLFNIGVYLEQEQIIRDSLLQFRGQDTDVSNEYIGGLIGIGWTGAEVATLLEAERQINTTDAFDNVNEILAFKGLEQISENDLLDIALGNPTTLSTDVFEVVNDALRQTALEAQGLDISTELAEFLGSGSSLGVAQEGSFSQAARAAALNIAANKNELDLEAFGLTEDDLIAAMFNDTTLTGRAASEIESILGKLSRNRGAAARGFESQQSFLNTKGRLVLPGLTGF